jgi:antitoxin component YwqK of YwqJK toxin-antitoxin module
VFFKNGKIKIEGNYIDGQLNGNWRVWNENEIVTSDETYELGKKVGDWKYYYDNGNKKSEVVFKDGLVKQTKEWDENGKLINSFSAD